MTPAWPTLRLGSARPERWRSRFRGEDCVWLSGGRYAMTHALRGARIRAGDSVLFPAYHCGSMVEPALWLGARADFYRLHEDLSPDLDDLVSRVRGGARAVVLTHFFGFPQPVAEVRSLCDESGAVLIEDCAHALFGDFGDRPPGSIGHFAVASTRKFCPGSDGGIACCNVPGIAWPPTTPPGFRRQVRSLYRLGAGMLGHLRRRLQPLPPRTLHSAADTLASPDADSGAREAPAAQWRWFSPSEEGVGMTAIAGLLFRLSDLERIGAERRANYHFLVESCAKLGRAAPLHPELPTGMVPYAFPLVLHHPAEDFRRLKYRGVPIWRWDESAVTDCEVSKSYRTSLLQLPCHESLSRGDLNWITGVLGEVLR